MTLWLKFIPTGSFHLPLVINADVSPAPAVMAGGMNTLGPEQHYLEDDGEGAYVPDPDKPPYRVPSMAEVRAVPWNGLTVASTFAGCGGSSTGYRMAGYRVLWANEFVPAAQDSYEANKADYTVLDRRDVRDVTADEILKSTKLGKGELDVLDGSPPCQAFSTAGQRHRGWGKERDYGQGAKTQRNEDMFFEYVRLLDGLQPRAFVAENVSGLVKGVAKGYFIDILKRLKACGYEVEAKLLDAQWLGVPQTRSRIIFVGVRRDLGLKPAFPSPLPYRYSVRDACPWLAGGAGHKIEPEAYLDRMAIGREADKLGPGEKSKKYFQLERAHPDKPSPAILAVSGSKSIASVIHPTERRKFTIAELRRIGSFPDDFVLTGTYGKQWERIGNSVPPLMMRAVAEAVRDGVLLPSKKPRR